MNTVTTIDEGSLKMPINNGMREKITISPQNMTCLRPTLERLDMGVGGVVVRYRCHTSKRGRAAISATNP